MDDICIPIEYCTIYFGKSKGVTIEFLPCKGVFFVQYGTRKVLTLFSAFFLAWLAVKFFLPLFSPFLFGTLLALAAEPTVHLLSHRFRVPRSVSAGIGVSLTFGLICAGLLVLCAFAVRELKILSSYLPDITVTLENSIQILRAWLLTLAGKTPDSIQPLLQERIHTFFSSGASLLDQTVRYILGLTGNLLSHIPDSTLTAGTAVLSAYMISAKLPKIRKLLLRRIRAERLEKLMDMGKKLKTVVFGWLLAQAKLMTVTFLLLLLGFQLLRINHPILAALAVSAVDAFPILGTGTVLLPWSLIRLLQGDPAHAIGLLGLYTTVSLLRSMLEPKLVGKQLGLDPLVTLIALYAGFQLWGIGGMLLAPLLTVTAIHILPEPAAG